MSKPWWTVEEPHATLVPYLTELSNKQRDGVLLDYLMRSVYEGRPYGNVGGIGARDVRRFLSTVAPRLKVTKSVVNTLSSKLIKRRALPIFTATDADWSLKTRAKRLSSYVRALLSGQQFDSLAPLIVQDMLVVGDGVVQVVECGNQVEFQRVPRDEIVLEPLELTYNMPRQMHRRRRMSRYSLLRKFPEHEREINAAPAADDSLARVLGATSNSEADEQVEVWESWHLPSSVDDDDDDDECDGRHCITIEGATLHAEEWKQDVFPFAFLGWSPPPSGFWSTGLVDDVVSMQVGVDKTYAAMVVSADANSGGYVMTRRGSAVVKGHFGGPGVRVLEYDGGVPPQFVAPSPFNPAQMQFLEWQIRQMYDLPGTSQAMASSRSPLGSNASGVALDNMMDIESDRFAEVELAYSNFRLMVARCIVAVNKHAASRADAPRVVAWDDGNVMRSIDWKKVDIERDKFSYKLEPTNFIPETRAGKLSAINELSKAGVITDPATISSLFDEPDLSRANRLQNAASDAVEALCEQAADLDEPYPRIDPHLDLARIVKIGKQFYNRLMANGAGKSADGNEALTRVRDLIGDAEAMLEVAAEGAAPPPGAMPPGGMPPDPMMPPEGVPTGAPMAPPPGMPGGLPIAM